MRYRVIQKERSVLFKARHEIQGDSGGKISTFGGDNIRHCGEKLFIMPISD